MGQKYLTHSQEPMAGTAPVAKGSIESCGPVSRKPIRLASARRPAL